jgi:hypothetical protein
MPVRSSKRDFGRSSERGITWLEYSIHGSIVFSYGLRVNAFDVYLYT